MIIFPLEIITLPEACGKSDREKILQPGVRSLDLAFLPYSADSRGGLAILLGCFLSAIPKQLHWRRHVPPSSAKSSITDFPLHDNQHGFSGLPSGGRSRVFRCRWGSFHRVHGENSLTL